MKWLDIETAPKDGSFLTGWDNGLLTGRWQWCKTKTVDGMYFNYETGKKLNPTHWMRIER